ncbi:(2Fe-2S)-binding protein [Oceaniglobus ichthyenteri]|uniref:(2Fe-2S)-binding protein n=1 Tax=Oceaniglobus ichthyenteri TaxID=2136177 RepID=UPI000D360613|nr:(2Fe-2S)-binding protein [Oceaniglobus ichthyenteri]
MSTMRRISKRPTVTITVDGAPLAAHAGDSVALALLAAGRGGFCADAPGGSPRAPLCLMGVCFGCLADIDGRAGEQACMVLVRDGMIVKTGGHDGTG